MQEISDFSKIASREGVMNLPDVYDVLIVGAGPTGLTAACELVRQGVRKIVVVDVNEQVEKKTKAAVVWPRSLELLENYPGVLDYIFDRCVFQDAIKVFSEGAVISNVPLGANMGSRFEFGAVLEQYRTEEALLTFLARANVQLVRGCEVIGVDRSNPAFVIAHARLHQQQVSFAARYVIGCDGAKSFLRKNVLGAKFSGKSLRGGLVVAHFRNARELPFNQNEVVFFLNTLGPGNVFAMPGGTWYAGVDLSREDEKPFLSGSEKDSRGSAARLQLTRDQLQELFRRRLWPDIEISELIWSSHFQINQRTSSKYWDGDRVFLAGDACHCHTPLGGQGMNTGIQDAVNIAWKLANVVLGRCSSSLLASYEEERKGVADLLVSGTGLLQNIASTRVHPTVQACLNRMIATGSSAQVVQSVLGKATSETIYNYRRSSICAEHRVGMYEKTAAFVKSWTPAPLRSTVSTLAGCGSHKIRAGDLHPLIGKPIAGLKLVFFEGSPAGDAFSFEQLLAIGQDLVARSNGLLGGIEVIRDGKEQFMMVIRPDAYVGFCAQPVSKEACLGWLREKMGQRF